MADKAPVKIFYHGILGRASPAIRMCAAAKVPYEIVSDFSELAGQCSAFGGQATSFAPPVVHIGSRCVSQSPAVALFVGEHTGFVSEALPVPESLTYMLNAQDFGSELGTASKDAVALKAFLFGKEGSPGSGRAHSFLSALERSIKGPFVAGDKPTYADFYVAGVLDWNHANILRHLAPKLGDLFAQYPKLKAAWQGILDIPEVKTIEIPVAGERFDMQKTVADAFNAS